MNESVFRLWRRWGLLVGAAALLTGGCHLALGLEPAAELVEDDESTSAPVTPECTDAGQCGDDNPCTVDSCGEDGKCAHEKLTRDAPDNLQTPGDCQVVLCQDGVLTDANDDTDLPVDGNECTEDVCASGVPDNPTLASGSPCTAGVCTGGTLCVECINNDHCTDPDTCGGAGTDNECGCTPTTCLALGLTCGNAANGCSGALNCDNNMQNGNETDVDCGGATSTCARRCAHGQACTLPSDCASNTCTGGFCVGN